MENIWKRRLRNGGHFVSTSMCWYLDTNMIEGSTSYLPPEGNNKLNINQNNKIIVNVKGWTPLVWYIRAISLAVTFLSQTLQILS